MMNKYKFEIFYVMLKYIYRISKKTGLLFSLEKIRMFSVKIEKHEILQLKNKCFITIFIGTFGGVSILISNYYINIGNEKRIFICNYNKILKTLFNKGKWFDINLNHVLVLSILESILLEKDSKKNSTILYPPSFKNEKYVCIKNNNSNKNILINKAGGFFHFYIEVIPILLKYISSDINIYFIIEDKSFYKSILDFYKINYMELVPNINEQYESIVMNKYYPSAEEIIQFKQFNNRFKLIETQPKKIYVTRKNESARRISNENDLLTYLAKLNFEIIDPGVLSFSEQVNYFKSADIIVSAHGAALSNIIWCKEYVKIIELNGDQDVRWHFAKIANTLNLSHTLILGKTIDKVYFETNIESIRKVIENLL